MSVWNLIALVILSLVGWWLTGYDSNLVRDGRRSDFWRRFLRILVTLVLVQGILFFPPSMIFVLVIVGVIWAGCLSDLFSRLFGRLVDPWSNDGRAFDPGKTRRYLDTIAHLIRNGRRDEAIRLCEELKQSGEVEASTLDATLEFLGVKQKNPVMQNSLQEAVQLRMAGRLAEAEQVLKSALAKNPADVAAAMLLMRLFAEDLRQPARAREVLQQLQKQPQVSPGHVDFARRSIDDWSQQKPKSAAAPPPSEPHSVDELLAQGFFGTAIERLEQKIAGQPQDFELRLKLAEVHAVYCKNFTGAEKVFRQMETRAIFSRQQMSLAHAKLKAWREAAAVRAA